MKLTEYKDNHDHSHYFKDERGQLQGEYKLWHLNGQLLVITYFRDDKTHGGWKSWHDNGQQRSIRNYKDNKVHGEFKQWDQSGKLVQHTFDINGIEIIDFLENPELYPETPEDKTYFALKYGIGGARFIK